MVWGSVGIDVIECEKQSTKICEKHTTCDDGGITLEKKQKKKFLIFFVFGNIVFPFRVHFLNDFSELVK